VGVNRQGVERCFSVARLANYCFPMFMTPFRFHNSVESRSFFGCKFLIYQSLYQAMRPREATPFCACQPVFESVIQDLRIFTGNTENKGRNVRNTEEDSLTLFYIGKAISVTCTECVSVVLVAHHVAHLRQECHNSEFGIFDLLV